MKMTSEISQAFTGAPRGVDAFFLLKTLEEKQTPILYIGLDDKSIAQMKNGLEFLSPELKIITFPAWDCLPYDRNSPHEEILSQRVKALYALQESYNQPCIILTTINAYLQKVPSQR